MINYYGWKSDHVNYIAANLINELGTKCYLVGKSHSPTAGGDRTQANNKRNDHATKTYRARRSVNKNKNK